MDHICVFKKTRQDLAELGKIKVRTQFGGYALSVDKVVFALISHGELYLRTSAALNQFMRQHPLMPFMFNKRGNAVYLSYYQIDAALWAMLEMLLHLAHSALAEARQCQLYKRNNLRPKDLPNLSLRLESLLRESGILTVEQLRQTDARECWTMIHSRNHHLGLNTLYALQGAITGQHQAVISAVVKEELKLWYSLFQQNHERSALKIVTVPRVAS